MVKILLSTLITVTASAPAPAPQDKEPAGEGFALLIAVNRHASTSLAPLEGSLNDVLALRRILTTRHGFAAERVRVLADEEATRRNILDAMKAVIDGAGENDTVYIHFSGYGSQVKDQNGDEKDDGLDETIVPHDGRTEGVADITDDELGEILDGRKSRHVTLVLDSSHAGTGTRGATIVRDRSAPPDARRELYARPARRDVRPLEESYVLLGAAAAGQAALDVRVDGRVHGLLSYCLARSLLRSPRGVTPRQLFAGIKLELRRIQE